MNKNSSCFRKYLSELYFLIHPFWIYKEESIKNKSIQNKKSTFYNLKLKFYSLMLDRYFVHPRLLKIFRYHDELCIFQIRRKLPPRTSSTEFSTIPTENSISYIRKGITNTSFSKKSFSTISRAHERLKFNIYSIPRKYFESSDSPTKKKLLWNIAAKIRGIYRFED